MARTPLTRTVTSERPVRRGAGLLSTGLAAALALTACAGDEPTPTPGRTGVTGTITVFAAASLTDVFNALAEDFEAANPGSAVEFNYGASSALAMQINEGAPADVLAAASPATMKTVTDAGGADGEPVVFVKNQLVIAVEEGNPKGIAGLADLTEPGVIVVLCAEQVPCGAAAKTAIESANLTITPASFEENVRAALTKVVTGDADAALVYRTDAAIEDDTIDAVEFPESAAAINNYPIAVLNEAPNKAGAEAFVAYVLSPAGIAKLTQFGFQQP
jgi:molybdate transport system substrate-binding protein